MSASTGNRVASELPVLATSETADLSHAPGLGSNSEEEDVNVLLCVSGSVAAIRTPELATLLTAIENVREVRIVVTESSRRFLSLEAPLPPNVRVYGDQDEVTSWRQLGDPVLHIDLRNWADVLLIAPLSANSLAKIAVGMCDNLVTCVARAWPVGIKPFFVAPAMNTAMWDHPVTASHLNVLKQPNFGVTIIPPIAKKLACGDVGIGAMASPSAIAKLIAKQGSRTHGRPTDTTND